MSNERIYTVFVRNWYRMEGGKLVPNPGARRTVLDTGRTREEAQSMCAEYNRTHKPGKLSRKAEFTSNF